MNKRHSSRVAGGLGAWDRRSDSFYKASVLTDIPTVRPHRANRDQPIDRGGDSPKMARARNVSRVLPQGKTCAVADAHIAGRSGCVQTA